MKEVTLPSGAILKITTAPFAVSKALYQAILEEARGLKLNPRDDVDVNFLKDIFCSCLSSPKVESRLWECMKRVTYSDGKTGDMKVTEDTFEPVEARDDYLTVCFEVARENILPFTKSLYAKYEHVFQMLIIKSPA